MAVSFPPKMFYQNTEDKNREGRKASVKKDFPELIGGWEGEGSKQYNDGTYGI